MSQSTANVIVLLGAGGHARVLVEVLRALGIPVVGYVAEQQEDFGGTLPSLNYFGDDAALMARGPDGVLLVNAVGSVDVASRRRDVFSRFSKRGFSFATVMHPSAILASDMVIGEGAQIMAGVVVQPRVKVGHNVLLNTRAVIDHDVTLADHVHVATGAVVAGGVDIGEASHIGTGATIIQGIRIGREALVAAGAVVVKDVPDGGRVAGVPARPLASSA